MAVLCFVFKDIFCLISLADRGLFCSDVSVIESTNNPTLYCTITGSQDPMHTKAYKLLFPYVKFWLLN